MVQYTAMDANRIMTDANVARARELKKELADAKARLLQAETARDALAAHAHLAIMALHDFESLPPDGTFRIIDGWNAILRHHNVSKLSSEDVSRLKADYLASRGIANAAAAPGDRDVQSAPPPASIWIVFDGPDENSFRSGRYRVTYTGGTGMHRADRLILDYVHAARLLGLDVSRICVETADRRLASRLTALGAAVTAFCGVS